MKTKVFNPGLFAVLLLLVTGCVSQANLTPAPGATAESGVDEAVVSVVEGVRMVAQVDEWPGTQDIRQDVVPVRVVIENNSGMPLSLRYREFALIATNGDRYSALPPFKIAENVEEPVTSTDISPIEEPVFTFSGFEIAPYYSSVYPGLTPYAGTLVYDPFYYDNYYTYWDEISLPTDEMLAHALPEGVLETGGRIEGYLYFEEIPAEVNRVMFTADLVDPETGNIFGEIRIWMGVNS